MLAGSVALAAAGGLAGVADLARAASIDRANTGGQLRVADAKKIGRSARDRAISRRFCRRAVSRACSPAMLSATPCSGWQVV